MRRVWGLCLMRRLNVSWQCVLSAQKASHTMDCTKSSVASKEKKGIVLLYSAFMRPHQSPVFSCGAPAQEGSIRASPEEGHVDEGWSTSPMKTGSGVILLGEEKVQGDLIAAF